MLHEASKQFEQFRFEAIFFFFPFFLIHFLVETFSTYSVFSPFMNFVFFRFPPPACSLMPLFIHFKFYNAVVLCVQTNKNCKTLKPQIQRIHKTQNDEIYSRNEENKNKKLKKKRMNSISHSIASLALATLTPCHFV